MRAHRNKVNDVGGLLGFAMYINWRGKEVVIKKILENLQEKLD
jgi:hypothetical protein